MDQMHAAAFVGKHMGDEQRPDRSPCLPWRTACSVPALRRSRSRVGRRLGKRRPPRRPDRRPAAAACSRSVISSYISAAWRRKKASLASRTDGLRAAPSGPARSIFCAASREIVLGGFGVLLERCAETRALRKAWQPRLGRRIHVRVLFCRPYFWYNDVLLDEFRHLLSIPATGTLNKSALIQQEVRR